MEETFPVGAILIPNKENYCIAVWTNEEDFILYLKAAELKITFDKRVLPHLVDGLIELQNQ
jgi:hypothetical protein